MPSSRDRASRRTGAPTDREDRARRVAQRRSSSLFVVAMVAAARTRRNAMMTRVRTLRDRDVRSARPRDRAGLPRSSSKRRAHHRHEAVAKERRKRPSRTRRPASAAGTRTRPSPASSAIGQSTMIVVQVATITGIVTSDRPVESRPHARFAQAVGAGACSPAPRWRCPPAARWPRRKPAERHHVDRVAGRIQCR